MLIDKLVKVIKSGFGIVVVAMIVNVTMPAQTAQAQELRVCEPGRINSIRQKHVKTFEKVGEAFDAEDVAGARTLLNKLAAEEDLNNLEQAYISNYLGNIAFSSDNLNGALREFRKILAIKEGVPCGFYNQIIYVVAQVFFSQEKYSDALRYAQFWFKSQEDPSADAYMLIGQAQYLLKRYDAALPNVQKGIQKYIELGSVPKEGWLNLLANIYRQKSDFRKMVPVLKQLVTHYPKKTYLLTMAGVFNELNQPVKMTAMYQAMYDQKLLTTDSELVTLASLHMSQENPYKAAQIMGDGIKSGAIKGNLKNNRLYSQALYFAREFEAALGPLAKAAAQAKDGELYQQLGQSYVALNRWADADSAFGKAINKGKLRDAGQVMISQGQARFEQKKYESAKAAFKRALSSTKSADTARKWIKYVDNEVFRLAELNKEIVINTDVDV